MTSLHVGSAQYDRELLEPDIDTGESANQAFSSGNTGPHRRVAQRHAWSMASSFVWILKFDDPIRSAKFQ